MNSEIKLRAALNRILNGEPRLIDSTRKLSIRAVEEEADLGNGTAYYYKDFADEVRDLMKVEPSSSSKEGDLMLKKYTELKSKYDRLKVNKSRAVNVNKKHAATLHKYQHALYKLVRENEVLLFDISELNNTVARLRRKNIVSIKDKSSN